MPTLLQDLTPFEQFELIAKQNRQLTVSKVLGMIAVAVMLNEVGHRKVVRLLRRVLEVELAHGEGSALGQLLALEDLDEVEPIVDETHIEFTDV